MVYFCAVNKSEKTRQMIIEVAAPLFNKQGIAGTSIDDVLKAAGVAKGCLYGHFESKEELSYAATDYLLQKLAQRRENIILKETTAKGRLHAFMDNHKDPLNSLINGGCPILNLGTEADDTNPVIKQKIQATIGSATKLLTDIIREGIKNGELSKKLNPEEFAIKIFAAIEGGNMVCRAMNNSSHMTLIIKSLKKELDEHCLA